MGKLIVGETLKTLKTLKDDSVDLGVTSPPYNKKEKANSGWLTNSVIYDSVVDKKDENVYQQEQIDVLNELYRIIKPGGSFFYNHKCRWERGIMTHPMEWISKTDWLIRQEIIWDRMIASNIRGWRWWQTDERIYWLYKPIDKNNIGSEMRSKHALLTSIWKISPERNSKHPAPFPIEIPTRIIHSILDDVDGVVIDPYCGYGTTMVAAKLLNKDYIGIDISENYINESKERLEQCTSEEHYDNKKFKVEIAKHIVNKTFKQRKAEGKWTKKKKNM